MVGPGSAAYLLFVLLPIGLSLFQSFTDRRYLQSSYSFVGLKNYLDLIGDEGFQQSVVRTFWMTAIVLVLPMVGGLLVALLLDIDRPVYRLLRSFFFIPIVLSPVVVSFIWAVILTDKGVLNSVLDAVGLHTIAASWLGSATLAPISVAVVTAWQMTGFTATIFLAALQGVPEELRAASRIDGASSYQTFRYVVWPLLAPAVTINVVLVTISALKLYDYAVVLTNGGPGTSSETMTMHVVSTTFTNGQNGLGAAQSLVVLLLITIVTVVLLKALQRREVDL